MFQRNAGLCTCSRTHTWNTPDTQTHTNHPPLINTPTIETALCSGELSLTVVHLRTAISGLEVRAWTWSSLLPLHETYCSIDPAKLIWNRLFAQWAHSAPVPMCVRPSVVNFDLICFVCGWLLCYFPFDYLELKIGNFGPSQTIHCIYFLCLPEYSK